MPELKISGHMMYTYKKPKGWFPHFLGGWTRLCCAIKVYDCYACADRDKPDGAEVVGVWKEWREEKHKIYD
jgi:hypothetical protein